MGVQDKLQRSHLHSFPLLFNLEQSVVRILTVASLLQSSFGKERKNLLKIFRLLS